MDQDTKDFLFKVLLWGGGGLLALVLLSSILNTVFTIVTFPFRYPWAFLILGGGGYYLYHRYKKNKETEKVDEFEDFEDFDEDFHFD